MAVQLVAQMRKALRVKLPMRTMFETPTVAGLVQRIERLRAETAAAPAAEQPLAPALGE